MSVDQRLRRSLHHSAASISPNVWEGLSSVLTRRRRRRQMQLAALGAAVIALAVGAAVLSPRLFEAAERRTVPAPAHQPTDGDGGASAGSVPEAYVGRYTKSLSLSNDIVLELQISGRWVLAVRSNGTLKFTGPKHPAFGLEDTTFRPAIEGSLQPEGARVTTDALANTSWCQGDAPGIYRWTRSRSELIFTVVDEPCRARRALLAGRWRERPG